MENTQLFLIIAVTFFSLQLVFLIALIVFYFRFQPTQQKAWNQFGSERRLDIFIDTIIKTLKFFVKEKIGALILLQGKKPLETLIVRKGVFLDAHCSFELLKNIFLKTSPMHDGAVIIDNRYRIVYTSVLVGLLKKDNLKNVGTRHLAASSVAKQTDSLAILISENNGQIKLFLAQQQIKIKEDNWELLTMKITEWNHGIR